MPFVENPQKFGAVCWKTGTSFGHRDAWCIGFGSRYVAGVWFGNFSGEGKSGLSGIDIAAPVFQQIIAQLERKTASSSLPDLQHYGWKKRQVCRKTGLKPSPDCLDQTPDAYLPLISSNIECTHYKSLVVNQTETIQYCPQCQPKSGTHRLLVENYSPEYIRFLQSKDQPVHLPPPHNPGCLQAGREDFVQFLIPSSGKEFFLENKESISLPLKAISKSGDYPIRFYANGKQVGITQKGEEVSVKFVQGKYKLIASDARGQSGSVTFSVNAF